MRNVFTASAALVLSLSLCAPAGATVKGLNQIVTPDIQPVGTLSISLQEQDPNIGNPGQLQLETGVTDRLEFAYQQGTVPGEEIGSAEYSLYKHKDYLLSAGADSISSRGITRQYYMVSGLYQGPTRLIVGGAKVGSAGQAIFGYGYQTTNRLCLQVDYQSSGVNASTYGFTYNITPNLQFNPALYVSNATQHLAGYAVVTYTVTLWKEHE